MATQVEKTPVDSGYAWVVLAACTFMYMFMIGGVKSYGILYTEFLEYFETGAGNTAWIGSLCTVFLLGLGPFANHLVEQYTFRWVMFTGGLLVGIGYLTSGFVDRMELMYLTFGVISGIGYGLIFSPCVTIINYYFNKNRALANGIVVAGSGVGGFCLPYIYRALIDGFMLPGALMIIGAIFFNICAASLILRQPMQLAKKKLLEKKKNELEEIKINEKEDSQGSTLLTTNFEKGDNSNKERSTSVTKCKCFQIFDWSLFKNPVYVSYVIGVTLHMAGFTANLTVLPAHVMSLGYGKQKVTIAVSIIGAAEIFSRIFFGWFSDRKIFRVRNILLFTMVVSGVSAILIPLFKSFEALVVYAVIVGIFPGAFWSLMSVLVLEIMGLERLPKAFGLMSLFLAVGVAFSQPAAGWIEDATGNWDNSFRFAGICSLAASIIFLMEPLFVRLWCCGEKQAIANENNAVLGEVDGAVVAEVDEEAKLDAVLAEVEEEAKMLSSR